MGKKRTYAEVKEFVENNSDCELLSEEYVGTFEPLRFRCSCGAEFETSWHKFSSQNHRRCAECGSELRASKKRRSLEILKQQLIDAGLEYISGDYKNGKSKITIRCRCGHEKTTTYNGIFHNKFSGLCPECAAPLHHGVNRLTLDAVREMCEEKGVELLEDHYENAKARMLFRCACGTVFESTWDHISTKYKACCYLCGQRASSGERAIGTWLKEHGFEYETEKSFPDLIGARGKKYFFDFYIPSENVCIEFDGQQHSKIVDYTGKGDPDELTAVFWATQIRDRCKTLYCERNGIRLLRITAKQYRELPQLLADMLIPR